MPQSRRQFLATLAATFFGSAIIHKITPAQINPSWQTAKPLPPSDGVALDWWSQVSDDALKMLADNLRCLKVIGADWPGGGRDYWIPGDTIRIREPLQFSPRDREPVDWGNINACLRERVHPINLWEMAGADVYPGDDLEFRSFSREQLRAWILEPAMADLAQQVFRRSQGAELLVTAPMQLPETHICLPAATRSAGNGFHLRGVAFRQHPHDRLTVRFDMLFGALR